MIDNTMLMVLNTIARKQLAPTELTEKWANQILDYCTTHLSAEITFKASNMQLKVYSNASYLNEPNANSSFVGYVFLGQKQSDVGTDDILSKMLDVEKVRRYWTATMLRIMNKSDVNIKS